MIYQYCVACKGLDNLHQHHLIPLSVGGSYEETNIITLCGNCHAKIHGNYSEWTTSKLTKKALDKKRNNKELVGSIPYGFSKIVTNETNSKNGRKIAKLIPNSYEQNIIMRIIELRKLGLSMNEISNKLYNDDKSEEFFGMFKPRSGEMFQTMTIKRIIDKHLTKE